jgi:hypothetical protein
MRQSQPVRDDILRPEPASNNVNDYCVSKGNVGQRGQLRKPGSKGGTTTLGSIQ